MRSLPLITSSKIMLEELAYADKKKLQLKVIKLSKMVGLVLVKAAYKLIKVKRMCLYILIVSLSI